MKTVSIGFFRDDGDFALFATLNNLDEHLNDDDFAKLIEHIASQLRKSTNDKVHILEREDALCYITMPNSIY